MPRKRIVTAEYSVENDLDVYRLSAQLSVINKDNIRSIGDLEGRICRLRTDYEKQRHEINEHIEEYNQNCHKLIVFSLQFIVPKGEPYKEYEKQA